MFNGTSFSLPNHSFSVLLLLTFSTLLNMINTTKAATRKYLSLFGCVTYIRISLSFTWQRREMNITPSRYAGHSKWSNIKHKKAHKDNARAKVFGKLSLEIIQAVKDNGSNPAHNPQLEAIITKAKSASMPKDKIEKSIKSALRDSNEKRVKQVFEARGPGKCGFMIDILSPNITRSKHEIKNILKKNDCLFTDDGSVAFMFLHKGVVNVVKDSYLNSSEFLKNEIDEAEEVAIMVGAEDVICSDENEAELKCSKFICGPLQVLEIQKELVENYKDFSILSAEAQYIAKSLVSLSEENIEQSDRIIQLIHDHPDVMNIYDNIEGYPSKTIKLKSAYD